MRTASTDRPPFPPLRALLPCLGLFLLAGTALCGTALAQQVTSHLIAAGGGTSRSPGGCRVLEGSVGQPALGAASGGAFTLRAGYWAGPGSQRRDSVFSGDFEECN
ncbi:hypothetical protein DFR29_11841 [Tahibacter aquaticus]|uniref:Uncharacterized protein n=1 Tax=Tahibacter aquaticus TaxID=520092 RepID=A0A4R6YMZ0_9GAMM|nr:hypothetical protein [Tahibacter aquaticus]TDR38898.1 hypothetical protein DFR29_11841 [Tahibacter aquaticus]